MAYVYADSNVIFSEKTKKRAEEHDKKNWNLIEPHRHHIGSLWRDTFGYYYLIVDVRLFPYDAPDFLIERVDTGETCLAGVKDFDVYHKLIS